MKKIQFIILMVLVYSCSLFINKDKILTENTWILSSTHSRADGIHQNYFKKTEKELVFKFFSNGTLEVTEKNINIPVQVNWKWESSDKEKIIIDKGNYSGELRIFTLDKNQLTFWQYEKESLNSISYNFLSSESKEWYEDEFVDGYRNAKKEHEAEKLDTTLYEIIKTSHASTVQNFDIWIKFKDFNQENIKEFIKIFRNENCTKQCNISIYDSNEILDLIDKEPLEGDDYIKVADHFIAMSSFDSPANIMWYPFQDFLYKEYGGKNWKKDEIK